MQMIRRGTRSDASAACSSPCPAPASIVSLALNAFSAFHIYERKQQRRVQTFVFKLTEKAV
jgi:hypothetical protein